MLHFNNMNAEVYEWKCTNVCDLLINTSIKNELMEG